VRSVIEEYSAEKAAGFYGGDSAAGLPHEYRSRVAVLCLQRCHTRRSPTLGEIKELKFRRTDPEHGASKLLDPRHELFSSDEPPISSGLVRILGATPCRRQYTVNRQYTVIE
jgi:hypothetical protein